MMRGKKLERSVSFLYQAAPDGWIHISNTASRPETHPALYEGLLRAQAERPAFIIVAVVEGHSAAKSFSTMVK